MVLMKMTPFLFFLRGEGAGKTVKWLCPVDKYMAVYCPPPWRLLGFLSWGGALMHTYVTFSTLFSLQFLWQWTVSLDHWVSLCRGSVQVLPLLLLLHMHQNTHAPTQCHQDMHQQNVPTHVPAHAPTLQQTWTKTCINTHVKGYMTGQHQAENPHDLIGTDPLLVCTCSLLARECFVLPRPFS